MMSNRQLVNNTKAVGFILLSLAAVCCTIMYDVIVYFK